MMNFPTKQLEKLVDQQIINQPVLENIKSLKTFRVMATDLICSVMKGFLLGQTLKTKYRKLRRLSKHNRREDNINNYH